MPLLVVKGADAVNNRKNNPFASWGDRNAPNRIEPVCKPSFAVPFRLEPGEKIFTVGSCFARNVEVELMKRGFQLPMRELFKRPEFGKLEVGIINNFGTPSIYNEFAWALGERPFVPEEQILPMGGDKFADLHLIPSMRPDTWEVALARRAAIAEAVRTVTECRVLIMTLGLVELWFDTRTGYYLNAAPRPTFMKNEPDRFELHVLSFDEAYRFLDDALQMVRKHGRPDLHVLLTVSPVPMMVTQRPEDVIVANTYSKSMLRTVAETIALRHDFVTYYPSYESVTLSDRKLAWADDMVHVTEEIVALNVGRMVDAFVGGGFDRDAVATQMASAKPAVAVERAQQVRAGSADDAAWFFAQFGALSRDSLDFALEHAQHLADAGQHEQAIEVIAAAPGSAGSEKAAMLACKALLAVKRPRDAMQRLDTLIAASATKSSGVWNLLLESAMETGVPDQVLAVLARWRKHTPQRAVRGLSLVGQWFHTRGELDRALSFLETALALNAEDPTARLYTVEALLAAGRRDEAKRIFADTAPQTATEIKSAERLRVILS